MRSQKRIRLSAVLLLAACGAFAQGPPPQKDLRVSAGIMVFGSSELLYTDRGEGRYTAFPAISLEYKSFYWKATELGFSWEARRGCKVVPFVQLLGGLGLAGAPSVFGGKGVDASDMADGYKGINDRDTQFEAGVRVELMAGPRHAVEIEGRGGERGGSAKLLYKQTYRGDRARWILSPFVAGRVLTTEFVDYYFGVSPAEAAHPDSYRIDSAYSSEDVGLAASTGLSGIYRFGGSWAWIASLEVQAVSDEISNSPLVRNRVVFSAGTGILYRF